MQLKQIIVELLNGLIINRDREILVRLHSELIKESLKSNII
jgi:hypothetical protein